MVGKYRCTVCGYVYDPAKGDPERVAPGTSFDSVPDDWTCPVCGVGKSKFEVAEEVVIRRYSNGEITVIWQPAKCNHNGNCWRRLPQVFDTKKRPWVYVHGADSSTIAKVVNECPTQALTWENARSGDEIRPK